MLMCIFFFFSKYVCRKLGEATNFRRYFHKHCIQTVTWIMDLLFCVCVCAFVSIFI